MVMVKAFGYGNGGFEIALNITCRIYLGVAFADLVEFRKTAEFHFLLWLNQKATFLQLLHMN
jgi:hypothetical protein